MKPEEVKAAIGDPAQARSLENKDMSVEKWGYPGDSVYLTFSKGVVSMIAAGYGVPFPGSPDNRFAGRTREDLGLGSTRDEVLADLGTPRSAHNDPNEPDAEFLSYRELGIEIGLWKGRVVNMIIHRR
jgi:hypothetical protein